MDGSPAAFLFSTVNRGNQMKLNDKFNTKNRAKVRGKMKKKDAGKYAIRLSTSALVLAYGLSGAALLWGIAQVIERLH